VHPASDPRSPGLTCAMRAIRRRVRGARAALLAFVTLMAERMSGVAPMILALRQALGTERVLVVVRCELERHLHALPAPVGFRARAKP